ncbi:hypothetical protein B0H17DRAFT_1335701 [Mycena rosella]|uniref:Uncharacterized protein n=1 Tax=Mycena rosella TaxID=1033263 RepID=A0AAD7G8E7_MYCRO|nr:hypothetical protein B0H17DRAFT_1335701 [Mycena rosella]
MPTEMHFMGASGVTPRSSGGLSQRPRIALIPGHLIVVARTTPGLMGISVLEIDSVHQQLRSLRHIDWESTTPLSAIRPLYTDTAPLDAKLFPESAEFRLSVYESPLTHRKFNIHMHVWHAPSTNTRTPSPLRRLLSRKSSSQVLPAAALLRFSLNLSSIPSVWTRRAPAAVRLPACFPDFEYAGLDMQMVGQHATTTLGAPRSAQITLPELISRSHMHMGAHSGALTMVLPFEIVVRYYE